MTNPVSQTAIQSGERFVQKGHRRLSGPLGVLDESYYSVLLPVLGASAGGCRRTCKRGDGSLS